MDIIDKTKALRAEAWQALAAIPEYRAYKGLDDAVRAMTGEQPAAANTSIALPLVVKHRPVKSLPVKRVTQADVAARVLKQHGEPLPIGRWLEKSLEQGIGIKGEDPLPNFRSMVSRNPRFRNFVQNNMYFWWLDGVELPGSWKEATDPSLPGLSAASDSIDQGGGGGHAANNTNLA